MASGIFRPSGKLFSPVLLALGILCLSVPALAQQSNAVAGCSATVWNALTAKAEAQVAYDVAVTRQMINKPDSVLTLTCFDKAAGVSATNGGAIFSGNFAGPLGTIMPVDGSGVYNCPAIGDLWNTIITGGINTGAPYATFDDLLNGRAPPGAGQDFAAGWNAAQTAGIFNNLKTAVAALPQPPQVLDFSGAKSSCDVLKTAGIIQDNCPAAGSFQAQTP